MQKKYIEEKEFEQAFERVVHGEVSPTVLRKELGLSHSTFYRYRKKYLENHSP